MNKDPNKNNKILIAGITYNNLGEREIGNLKYFIIVGISSLIFHICAQIFQIMNHICISWPN